MNLRLNLDSISLLLFCGDIIVDNTAPLTHEEWSLVEKKLKILKKKPSHLFGMNKDTLVDIVDIDEYVAYKMISRLATVNELFHALTNLETEGIFITTKYEEDFPGELSESLKKRAPLFLYYVGDMTLLSNMVSVIGPQTMDKGLESFTKNLITKLYDEDRVLVTNGSKGVDAYAMKKYLSLGGKVVCFVSDHMFDKKMTYSKYINNGQLLILSAIDPFAYFNVTATLDRNIYICGLSDLQFITATHINSGGHWFTTIQNMHYNWTKELVLHEPKYTGNLRLLEMGVTSITYEDVLSLLTIDQIIEKNIKQVKEEEFIIDQMSIYEFLEIE